jgi:hypothetical protein
VFKYKNTKHTEYPPNNSNGNLNEIYSCKKLIDSGLEVDQRTTAETSLSPPSSSTLPPTAFASSASAKTDNWVIIILLQITVAKAANTVANKMYSLSNEYIINMLMAHIPG